METLKQIEERLRKEEEIRCPHCEELQPNDDMQYPISYHSSEDGPEEWTCVFCDKIFFVKENVRRSYEVSIDKEIL